jgi:hypothetical protein
MQKIKKKGIWGDDKSKKNSLKNIKWDDKNSKEVFNKFKGSLTCLVEHVLSGSTIKVLIGNQVISLHMTGVQSPSLNSKNDKGEKKKRSTICKRSKTFYRNANSS